MQNNGNKGTNLELIKERLDIVDVISTYVRLEKSGSQFKARCPFHSEKSASFYVSPHKGYFHCFGCAAHGDIFTFITKIEGIEFKDALKLLADRAGVTLSNIKREDDSKNFDILEIATKFFQMNLANNFEAIEYIKSRGIENVTVESFRIGFAPNDWRALYTHLKNSNFTDEEILESGLCIKHEKGLYDRFRSRIMFPIANASGKVVAFTGRIIGLDKDGKAHSETQAKYVNSPETKLYHKSSVLFAYDKAKKEIVKTKRIILVEGQMDAVMSHQADVTDTVAISGTALTQEHINIIKRFADTIVLSLDTDKAGFEAMKKSAAIALFNDLQVEGLDIGDAKDPAEIISENKNDWLNIIDKPVSIFKLFIDKIIDEEQDKSKQVARVRKEIFPILSMVRSEMQKNIYANDIALYLDLDKNSVLSDLKTLNLSEDNLSIQNKKILEDKKILTENKEKSKDRTPEEVLCSLQAIFELYKNGDNTIAEIVSKYKKNIDKIILKYEEIEDKKIEIQEDLLDVKMIEMQKNIDKEISFIKKTDLKISDNKEDNQNNLELNIILDFIKSNYSRFLDKIKQNLKSDKSIELVSFIIKNRIQ